MDYKHLFDHNPNPCWVFDLNSLEFLAVNLAAVEHYGYSKEEFFNLTIRDLRTDEDMPEFESRLERIHSEEVYSDVWRHRKKCGTTFYVRIFSQKTNYFGRDARFVTAINVDRKIRIEHENQQLMSTVLEQKAKMDQILSSIHEVIWSCDATTFEMQFINGACFHVFGYHPNELMGKAGILRKNILKEDLDLVDTKMSELENQGYVSLTFRILTKGGELKYIESHCALLSSRINEPSSITGVSIDVTSQEIAKLEARNYSEQVSEILESITDAFFAVDNNWRFTYINKQCELAFPQMKRQEVLGQTFWNVFPRASELKFYPYLNKAMNERVTQEFEEYSPSANCWFFVKAYPTREGLSVSLRDISDKILLQDNLRIEQRNLLSLINNSPDIIWSVDHEYRLLSFNHGYAEVIKLWSGQMPRKGVCTSSYARGDEDRVEWEAYYNRALKGEMFQFESNYLLGEYERCIDTRIYPIRDVDHKVIGVSCNSRDITDYRKQLRLAEAQNQRLRDIAWIQSHKVRAPLASILGLVELYERETPSDVNNVDLIDKIKLAASELDRVIHELVGATRLDLHTPMDS